MRKITKIAALAFFAALVLSITAATSNTVPLGGVQDTPSAVNAIQEQVSSMADQIREAPVTSVNIATQYAEAAVGQLGMQRVDGAIITINRETVMNAAQSVLSAMDEAADALSQSLAKNNVEPFRGLSSAVTFVSTEPGMITLKIDPDVQYASVDYVRVETALYAVSIKPVDLVGILEAPLTITLEDIGEGAEPEIRVTISDPEFAGYLTLSLPTGSGDLDCMAIVEQGTGTASPGSYNPIESRMDGRIDVPGVYLLANNGKNFTDIGGQTPAVQKAIRELAALGVTNGKTATTFSPDEKITRGQFTAMIMRAIHKVDNSARANYADVPSTAYYSAAIASATNNGYMSGFEDGYFRPGQNLKKAQICKVVGLILNSERKYSIPENVDSILGNYYDTVIDYARKPAALLTRAGVISYLPDHLFRGDKELTRGETALILYEMIRRM